MSWTTNTEGECNNENCRQVIYWNQLVTHPRTGRPRPLNMPYYPDHGQEPDLHQCMQEHRPGQYLDKYRKEDEEKMIQEDLIRIPRPPVGVRIGQTHLYVNGDFVRLLKCPYCHFRNIHEYEITHHIIYTDDKNHNAIDVGLIDRSLYIVK